MRRVPKSRGGAPEAIGSPKAAGGWAEWVEFRVGGVWKGVLKAGKKQGLGRNRAPGSDERLKHCLLLEPAREEQRIVGSSSTARTARASNFHPKVARPPCGLSPARAAPGADRRSRMASLGSERADRAAISTPQDSGRAGGGPRCASKA